MQAMVQAEALGKRVQLPDGELVILQDVAFAIAPGSTAAVVGARPTLTVPDSRARRAARAACSAWRKASCASRKKATPASVGATPRGVRLSSDWMRGLSLPRTAATVSDIRMRP